MYVYHSNIKPQIAVDGCASLIGGTNSSNADPTTASSLTVTENLKKHEHY